MNKRRLAFFCLLLVILLSGGLRGAAGDPPAATPEPSPYLFIWAGDADRKDSDFLAVVDARPTESTYGQIVATLPVGRRATQPHHTEYEFPAGGVLFANGWAAGRTFVLDLRNPRKPRLAGEFTQAEQYAYPHSFARLPNGNVLATFQSLGPDYLPPGGLVELDPRGRTVRAVSAATAEVDSFLIWPYSLAVLPSIDRVVTTSTQMGLPQWLASTAHDSPHAHNFQNTYHVQVWSLRDLRLLSTFPLLPAPGGQQQLYPAEPRVLPDGSVYVNTFNCGLYRMTAVDAPEPTIELVHTFPGSDTEGTPCALPAIYGKYWVQTVAALPGLIALDISDPARPVEVSRLVLDPAFPMPHWLAVDRTFPRLVLGGDDQTWVLVVNLDPETGKLALDEEFREKGAARPGISFERARWPHGKTGPALAHGSLFGP